MSKFLSALLVVFLVVGCDDSKKDAQATEGSKVTEKNSASAVSETPSPAEPPKLDAGGLGEVGKVLGEALNAAATVDASSATPCEQAYDGIEAMKQALEKSGKAASGKPMPPRGAFLQVCEELPEANQKCMVISYAMANAPECKKAKDALDPKLVAKMKKLLGE